MLEAMQMIITKLDKMEEKIENRFDNLENRFDNLENSFDNLESSFDNLENSFDNLENSFDNLENGFDVLEGRFNNLEGRFGKLEKQFKNFEKLNHEEHNMILEDADTTRKYLEGRIDRLQTDIIRIDNKYEVLLHEQEVFKIGTDLAINLSERVDALENDVENLKTKN